MTLLSDLPEPDHWFTVERNDSGELTTTTEGAIPKGLSLAQLEPLFVLLEKRLDRLRQSATINDAYALSI